MHACVYLTLFCFSLLPLLLWRQGLLQKLHVKLIFFLDLLLFPKAHLIAHVALEAEAQRDHWVTNAAWRDTISTLVSLTVVHRSKKYRFYQHWHENNS